MKSKVKSLIYCLSAVCMSFSLFSGCEKEDNKPIMNNMMVIDHERNSEIEDELRTFYYFEAGFYLDPITGDFVYRPFPTMFCAWPKGNCLPDVTINEEEHKGNELYYFVEEFDTAYKNGKLNLYFNNNHYLNLVPKIDELNNVKTRIIDGEILFHLMYSGVDSTKYYVALPKDVEIIPGNTDWVNHVECVISIKLNR